MTMKKINIQNNVLFFTNFSITLFLFLVVMVFDLKEGEPLPKKVKYTIRLPSPNGMNWKTERTYSSDGYTDGSI